MNKINLFSANTIKISVNTFYQILGRLITSFSTFIITFIIARRFGPEGYGDFTKIITFIPVFYLFADFGINAVYIQNTAGMKSEDEKNILWNSLVVLRVMISIVLIFFILCLIAFLPSGDNNGFTAFVKIGMMIYAPTVLTQAIITTYNAKFQLNLEYFKSALSASSGSLASLVLVVVSVYIFAPWLGIPLAILSMVFGSFATAYMSHLFVSKGNKLVFSYEKRMIRDLLRRSLPIGATLIFNVLYFRADVFLLTLLRSTYEVGIYGMAYKIFEFPLVIPTFFMNAVYPLLIKDNSLQKSGMKVFHHKLTSSFVVMIIAGVISTVTVMLISPYLVFIRQEFAESISALRILSLGFPVYFASAVIMWGIIAAGAQSYLLPIYGFSMLINIILNYIYIPVYGYMASAWLTVISESIIIFLLMILYIKKIRSF